MSIANNSLDHLHAIVSIRSLVPDNAATAGTLGTVREGVGVRINADGLIATIGYLCLEASEIWITGSNQQTVLGYIVAQDFESGIALLLPSVELGQQYLPLGKLTSGEKGQDLRILNGFDLPPFDCRLLSISEFSGRWEYLIESALYTLPACDNWGGAALLDDQHNVVGIGSLFLQFPSSSEKPVYGNLFVPTELLLPHLESLIASGRRKTPPRPWIGAFVDEVGSGLEVVGLYTGSPASDAGLETGDRVLNFAGAPLKTLSGFLRTLWSQGQAGTAIPISLERDGEVYDTIIYTVDRADFFQEISIGGLN
ncbi:MAG: S1-C subfamily serine protease [Parasphingorhabdus sp.]|jgi:S1-C subfamily serine protease